MKILSFIISVTFFGIIISCNGNSKVAKTSNMDNTPNQKLIIYQLLPRLFGNKNTTNKTYGSITENGVGKFNDINDKALQELKKLGITYVWYTGVIEHATMTDYSQYGIKKDDPDVVKGIAGSPYAIKDYYDVDPDLAVNVKNRMHEYQSLIDRTHKNGLKVLMDFIPNHVSRTYQSDAKPAGVRDFGEDDDKTQAFSAKNDFYYIPHQNFQVPAGYNAGGDAFKAALKDGKFDESPAKATGNDVFKPDPSLNDWFETIKLNYGIDVLNHQNHFDPIPPVWLKMRDILTFWAKKGVDGFRCDVAEAVPVEFWSWVIPEIKKIDPHLVFIAEAYNPSKYETYINQGKFDFLYDKVGLYDALRKLIKDQPDANIKDIQQVVEHQSVNFPTHMLRFLENHDEERVASKGFAQNPFYALPAMAVCATLNGGPVMIYMGQEVGEPASGIEGFGGDDNRTSIFDYWGVPNHQKWMNNGAFDGGLLNPQEKELRNFYQKLLIFSGTSDAIKFGKYYDLNPLDGSESVYGKQVFAYFRYTKEQRVLVIANFNRNNNFENTVQFPEEITSLFDAQNAKPIQFTNCITGETFSINQLSEGLKVNVKPSGTLILSF